MTTPIFFKHWNWSIFFRHCY